MSHGTRGMRLLRAALRACICARNFVRSCRGDAPAERVRAISTARLWASQPLHLPPIDVVVSDGPQYWTSYL